MSELDLTMPDESTHINVWFTVDAKCGITAHVGVPRQVFRSDGYLQFDLKVSVTREWTLQDHSTFGGAQLVNYTFPARPVSLLFEQRCNMLRAELYARSLEQLMTEFKTVLYDQVKSSDLSPLQQAQVNAWLWTKHERWEIDNPQPERGEDFPRLQAYPPW